MRSSQVDGQEIHHAQGCRNAGGTGEFLGQLVCALPGGNAGYPASKGVTGRTAFTVLAVNFRESRATVWRFRNLLKVDFPLLLDVDGKTAADWLVAAYPTTYLLGTNGRIRHIAYGQLQWDDREILQTIEALLAESETAITARSDSLSTTGAAATTE
ncbi:MAG: TlpA disulfide reductase family protein [Gammaproteobacteria bacterium]